MSSNFSITCPNCKTVFEPSESIKAEVTQELEAELNKKAKAWQQQKEEDFRKKEQALQQELQSSIQKKLTADFEVQLKQLQQAQGENEEKLKQARTKELEFLKQQRELKEKEEALEITLQKKINEEREKLSDSIRKTEAARLEQIERDFNLKLAEKEKQLETQIKLAEEMKKKAEQGSMQLQGEVQELLLEDLLKNAFPFDSIEEVGKGVKGADCIQYVQNKFGDKAGAIIYESKRTKDFSKEWIDKLKADMRSIGADVAVIVTQTLPKDMDKFGEKDGVYICSFNEVKSVAGILRMAILKMHEARKSQENKGDKMVMLYNYLTSTEFAEQWNAIREGFLMLKQSIQKERDAMERLWKSREKQLEKVLLNATHIRGSIEGIAGADTIHLELNDEKLLEE